MKYKVSYSGFIGVVERYFPTIERAKQWLRQVGKWHCPSTKIEEVEQ